MHLLILHFVDGDVKYFGPFPTYFRANEYALYFSHADGYSYHRVVKLTLPHTMRVKFNDRRENS